MPDPKPSKRYQTKRYRTDAAISRLAAMFDGGELQASTDPAGFLNRVADMIDRLRKGRKDPTK